jgi:hypothetical protein
MVEAECTIHEKSAGRTRKHIASGAMLPPMPTSRFLRIAGEHRFLLLFLFLLATLLAYPYTESAALGTYVFRVLIGLVTALSVFAVSFRRGIAIVAVLLAIPSVVQHLVNPDLNAGFLPLLNLGLSFAFDVFIVVRIFRQVFAKERVTSQTIFAALCIYILNGLTFASVYGLIAALQPRAFFFDPSVNLHTAPDRFDFIFYSFGMMTQLGAVGITAVTEQARAWSMIEAMLGQLYLAVLIARLVSGYRMGAPTQT